MPKELGLFYVAFLTGPTGYIIEQLGKRHKIIPIPWACPMFPSANFTVALVGTNIGKYDMQSVTATFAPLSL